jgi:predicted phage terminase large subunit-like protein
VSKRPVIEPADPNDPVSVRREKERLAKRRTRERNAERDGLPLLTKACNACGAEFRTRAPTRHRCDTCMTNGIFPAKPPPDPTYRLKTHEHVIIPCMECGTEFKKPAASQVMHCKKCFPKFRFDAEFKAQKAKLAEERRVDLLKRELAMRELAARKLIAFVVRNQSDYLPGWVHKDIAARLEQFLKDVVDKKSPRLMLQLPPRSGKSRLASHFFPAWAIGNHPWLEVIACSYAASLAMEFSKSVRELLRSAEYAAVFPEAKLHPDEQNAEGWKTTGGGGYLPAGVGGPITGRGSHILIIDDPVKNAEEADSQTDREAKKAWYQSTAYTRLAPGGGVLVIQTRWHQDDLSGWLEAEMLSGTGDQFEIVRYPMVAVEDEPYRAKGDVLHPERYDLEAARRIERTVGPRTWAALYQQTPVSDAGQYFSPEMFRYYVPPAPPQLSVYAAFDLAIGKNERNDYTAGMVIGVDEGDDIWVLDVARGRWDAHQIVEEILRVQRTWEPIAIGVEKGQIQLAIGPYLEKRIREEKLFAINIEGLPTGRRDKLSRARAIQGRMKQGRVKFPEKAPWLEALQLEMLAFPDGRHDDMVDSAAHLGLWLEQMTPAQSARKQDPKHRPWKSRLSQFVQHPFRGRTPMSA